MNREQALSKIKKCLALAKSANAHEAAAAMRQAQKLMAEHALDLASVELSDVVEERARAAMNSMPNWEVRLANLVGDAFGCRVMWTRTRRLIGAYRLATDAVVIFIGSAAGAQVARYAFEVLSRQCAKLRLAHIQAQPKSCKPITRTARGDHFAGGWVYGVEGLVSKFAGNDVDPLLIEQYVKAKFPEVENLTVKNRAVGRNVKDDDMMKGYAAGKNAQLNHGLGGVAQRGLLT